MTDFDVLRKICTAYEAKLKELLGEDEFHVFAENIAKELFAEEICAMADGEFKDMILDNFDAITGTPDEYQDLLDDIQRDKYQEGDDNDCGADY